MADADYQRTRIKICGIRDQGTAEVAISAGADALGFVFAKGSPRQVTCEQAEQIALGLAMPVPLIGVFQDEKPKRILEVCQAVGLTMVQLHGQENEEAVAEIALDIPVIRAVNADPDRIARWSSNPDVECLLIDGPQPGSGRACNWTALASVLQNETPGKAIILAGGLAPANVFDAICAIRPFAVDVSSGVESTRGNKDAALIRAFCAAVARADLRRTLTDGEIASVANA